MADLYIFDIDVIFKIEVERKFTKDEIEFAGGISNALKGYGKELVDELSVDLSTCISLYECPTKRKKDHKYLFSFILTDAGCPFDEDEVDSCDEELGEVACDKVKNEWKNRFENLVYPVKEFEVLPGNWLNIEKENEQNQ